MYSCIFIANSAEMKFSKLNLNYTINFCENKKILIVTSFCSIENFEKCLENFGVFSYFWKIENRDKEFKNKDFPKHLIDILSAALKRKHLFWEFFWHKMHSLSGSGRLRWLEGFPGFQPASKLRQSKSRQHEQEHYGRTRNYNNHIAKIYNNSKSTISYQLLGETKSTKHHYC